MKYLFISAHCDDAMISCGGTMLKLMEDGNSVSHLSLSNCDNWGLVQEFTDSNKILGINGYCHQFKHRTFHEQRSEITKLLYACKDDSDFIVTNSVVDKHSDHKTLAEECLRIFNCNIITYMGCWNGNENPNYFIEITGEQLEKKINALWCYRSQAHRPYMSADFIRAQARVNGVKVGKQFAEGFRVQRLIV